MSTTFGILALLVGFAAFLHLLTQSHASAHVTTKDAVINRDQADRRQYQQVVLPRLWEGGRS